MITQVISIRKSDILVAGAIEKKVNDAAICLDGIEYDVGSLMFLCFSGALDLPSGLYRGALCFEEVKDCGAIQPGGVADFRVLLAMDVSETPMAAKEVDDEL